jgi:hypothetical protein
MKPTDCDDYSAGFDLEQSSPPLYFLRKEVVPASPRTLM